MDAREELVGNVLARRSKGNFRFLLTKKYANSVLTARWTKFLSECLRECFDRMFWENVQENVRRMNYLDHKGDNWKFVESTYENSSANKFLKLDSNPWPLVSLKSLLKRGWIFYGKQNLVFFLEQIACIFYNGLAGKKFHWHDHPPDSIPRTSLTNRW